MRRSNYRTRPALAGVGSDNRSGFTRFELLALLMIFGAMIAIVLPAIQSAREQSRRNRCSDNLKQLGLGLNNYHDARKKFPYSQVSTSAGVSQYGGKGEYAISCISENQGPNWFLAIEPFLEGSGFWFPLYNKNAFYIDSANNISCRSYYLKIMLCPSDSNALTPYNGSTMLGPAAKQGDWTRGCYAANAVVNDTTMGFLAGIPAEQQAPWTDTRKRGVMLPNIACTQKQIVDGTSKTVLLAEIRADIGASGNRGIWAGTSGTSALFGHGCATQTLGTLANDDVGPNSVDANARFPGGDSTTTCKSSESAAGSREKLFQLGMGCVHDEFDNKQSGPKSMHPGGLMSVFCDGSVHWIDNDIQVGIGTEIGYWEMLFLSANESWTSF
jgi:type II secretory pathway pseudopilin PulG